MNKHKRERAILQMVYDEEVFESVTQQEAPDFVLRHPGSQSSFGVEITELYETEADARIIHHPKYMSELLAGGAHMHKEDVAILDVASVTIRDKNGQLKQADVPAIVRRKLPHVQHADALTSAISRKNELVGTYEAGLSHVNLVVLDRFDVPFGGYPEFAVREVITPTLRSALVDTQFREVFLVSSTPDAERIYRPLRMLLLFEGFFLFSRALASFGVHPPSLGSDDLAPLYVRAMQDTEMKVDLGSEHGDHRCAMYAGTGIRHTGDQIRILDFFDRSVPTSVELPDNPYSTSEWDALVDHYRSFVESNALICELALPVRSEDTV